MKETIVSPMKCVFVNEGLLKIDRIGAGVGVIMFNSAYKTAAGFHVLRAHPPEGAVSEPAYYIETAVPYALDYLKGKGIMPPYSVAVAGGASLMDMPSKGGVGSKLLVAVKETLAQANLKIKIEETGGNKIRTMMLHVDAGKIRID